MPFEFFNPAKEVGVTQGHLPHWDQEGATYFITWRTADSIPKVVWLRWRDERDAWLLSRCINPSADDWRRQVEDLPEVDRQDFRRFSKAWEHELDTGHGECVLSDPKLAELAVGALRFFDGDRYVLGDFVVMPNHVHLLVGGMPRNAMLRQVESLKKWSAMKINQSLGRSGRFWQDESFDHLVMNEASFGMFMRYIADNPVRARLRKGEFVAWRREE